MKRIIAILMLVAMTLSMVACGGGKQSFDAAKNQEGGLTEPPAVNEQGQTVQGNFAVPSIGYDPNQKVTIVFGTTMNQDCLKLLDKAIERFNVLYPNIEVVPKSYGGWDTIADLIGKEINGGNQPNIAYCYPDHVAQYRKSWVAVTMDELAKSTIEVTRADGTTETLGFTQAQLDDFIPGFYAEGTTYEDGYMYTLPFSKSTELLYYNKTYFDEKGYTVPTTWDEMIALCRKIKAEDPTSIPLGYDSADNLFITMCEQYGYGYTSATGEEKFLFNNDGCKEFVKQIREWYIEGLITTKDLYGAYTSELFIQQDKTISHSYMCIGSSGGAKNQKPENGEFEVGIAPIPQINPANPKVIMQGPSLCILKGGNNTTDQHIVASWLFVKFLTTDPSFQAQFSMMQGYTPVIKSAQEAKAYADWLAKANGGTYLNATAVKVALQQESSYFTSPAFVGSSVARTEVGNLLGKCMSESSGDIDAFIDQAFEQTYKKCSETQMSK